MHIPNRFSSYIIGEGTMAMQCAHILLNRGHEVCGIISSSAEVRRWAESRGVTQIDPSANLVEALAQRPFDYLFSIVNFLVLPQKVFELPRQGAINFHDGPLPKYAGYYATSWALLRRETKHAVTWHSISSQIDGGDILKQHSVEITPSDTAFSLNTKCYEAGLQSFTELVDELANRTNVPRKQNLAERTYFSQSKRPPTACVLSWNCSASEISALVRALDFGPYTNQLGRAKLALGSEFFNCPEIEVLESMAPALPGTVTRLEENCLTVASADRELAVRQLLTLDGKPVSITEVAQRFGLKQGDRLPELDPCLASRISNLNAQVCKHEAFWVKRLQGLRPANLPYPESNLSAGALDEYSDTNMPVPDEVLSYLEAHRLECSPEEFLLAAFSVFLVRMGAESQYDIGLKTSSLNREIAGLESLFSNQVPLRVQVEPEKAFTEVLKEVQGGLDRARRHTTYSRDVFARYPELRSTAKQVRAPSWPVRVELCETFAEHSPEPGTVLCLMIRTDARQCRWVHNAGLLGEEHVRRMAHQFTTFLLGLVARPEDPVADFSLLTPDESRELLSRWNTTTTAFPERQLKHDAFENQVQKAPEAVALVFGDQELSYRELNASANQLAHYLRKQGVGPDVLVGICVERSLEMVVGLLGILKAGGAYLPLDPAYPQERLAFMLEDSKVAVLLTQSRLAETLPAHQAKVVCLDGDWNEISREPVANVESGVKPHNLAYVIYTSGSTGKPKGVMVTHRNVVNFFTGMDARVGAEPPGVWLAVTSISFDISVLELFWTLARGFKVVLYAEQRDRGAGSPSSRATQRKIEFSLFYFASDEGKDAADRYRLLLEGAKFADEHGFAAVWTPERHFHAFGGLYPNPSVTSAAIAVLTKRVKILAGSLVLPLHNPICVAEEWSVVDNLSKGRVGISFAPGWQINDFVLAPENYAGRKDLMFREIETVRKLWHGEAVTARDPKGKEVAIKILPRPVQPELPIWITAAGNPETFKQAGELGASLLTHLLGQNVEELSEKTSLYRQAWKEKGHPGEGHVTLMLHAFVGRDMGEVRETVRKPFTEYLRSSVDLIKNAPWAFPTFKQPSRNGAPQTASIPGLDEFTEEEIEAILDHAFDRYFETSGLFGTPDSCKALVDRLKLVGVDEIACLIDFGIETDTVLTSLNFLNQVRKDACRISSQADHSLPALIARHQVTHLQCTPSMARILLANPGGSNALKSLRKLLLGGEALSVPLVKELRRSVGGEIHNMYGPTETTVWSASHRIEEVGNSIPIGRPIANTEIYLLDKNLQPVPIGVPGELFIGGAGVVRGYLNRPELTQERFVPDLFRGGAEARLYRTGDLARYRPDGNIEFLGRIDHQVKIRGFRIELGEIEAVLAQHPDISEAAVVVREDPSGDQRLVAYVVLKPKAAVKTTALRSFLQEKLPDHMLPSAFMLLKALPLTPNGKVDRRALPEPERFRPEVEETYVAPQNDLEQSLVKIWQEVLNLEKVGIQDNFFDLGGHSLLMMQVHGRLRESLNRSASIVELFRYPTIRSLASYLCQGSDEQSSLQESQHRAQTRKEAMMRQQQLRQKLRAEAAR